MKIERKSSSDDLKTDPDIEKNGEDGENTTVAPVQVTEMPAVEDDPLVRKSEQK